MEFNVVIYLSRELTKEIEKEAREKFQDIKFANTILVGCVLAVIGARLEKVTEGAEDETAKYLREGFDYALNKMNTYQRLRERVFKIEKTIADRYEAIKTAELWGDGIPIGVIYRNDAAPCREAGRNGSLYRSIDFQLITIVFVAQVILACDARDKLRKILKA